MRGKEFAPQGAAFDQAVSKWQELVTDQDAGFDKEYHFAAEDIQPMMTFGTNPGMGIGLQENIPLLEELDSDSDRRQLEKSLAYMDLEAGSSMRGKRSIMFSLVLVPIAESKTSAL